MQPLSPNTRKLILRTRKNKGARDQIRGTKKEVCSDGACVVGPPRYYHIKPKANNSSEKKRKIKRVSPHRKRGIRRHKNAIGYPGMKIKRRTSSINRSLQKKAFDPFPAHLRRDSSFARSLQKKLNKEKKAIDPFPAHLRRDSSFARSLQKKLNNSHKNKNKRNDSSFARSLQMKMDKSLARSLQEKHDLSAAKFLDRLINKR